MTKYFETQIKHPQTKEDIIVYCKTSYEESATAALVYMVYPDTVPFMMVKDMKVSTIEQEPVIQKNYYVQQVDFVKNLFG